MKRIRPNGRAKLWEAQNRTGRLRWTGIVTVLAILFGTFLFWRAEVHNELESLRKANAETGAATADQIKTELYFGINELERMAERVRTHHDLDQELWAEDAKNYIDDNPTLQAIEWINKDLKIQWIEPLKGNEKALDLDITFESKRQSTVGIAIKGQTSMSRAINLVQGGRGFLVYAPVLKNGKFQGMIAGVYRVEQLLARVPANTKKASKLEVLEGSDVIVTNGNQVPENAPVSYNRIHCLNSTWILRTTAGTSVSALGSTLGILILCAGLVLAILAALIFVYLDRFVTLGSIAEKGRRFLEGMTEASASSIYVFEFRTRRMVYSNRFGYESLGLTEQQLLDGGLPLLKKLVHPEDWSRTKRQFAEVQQLEDGEIYDFEHRIKLTDGKWHWIAYRECILERDTEGNATKVLLTSLDITEARESESALAQAKEDLEKVLEHAPIGMAMVGLDGSWIDVNPALCKIIGYEKDELVKTNFQAITHPDDLENDLEKLRQVLDGEINSYSMEKRYYHKSGRLVWILLCVSLVRYADGRPRHFISQIQDISEHKLRDLLNQEFTESLVQHTDFLVETNSRLEQESRTDSLTGLANRRFFGENFTQAVGVAQRYNRPLCAIMLDVDHFKSFNDDFGHSAGDEVLKHVAVVLREVCRDADFPARWGGEEFVVLCPETDIQGAVDLAERFRKAISEIALPYRSVTASFGVASLGADPGTLFERADTALYEAKDSGRNRVVVEEPSIRDRKSA